MRRGAEVERDYIRRGLGISYKTAWHMCHRIREGVERARKPGFRGIIGSYHRISTRHLQRYVDEYCWRSNEEESSFGALLGATTSTQHITYAKLTENR